MTTATMPRIRLRHGVSVFRTLALTYIAILVMVVCLAQWIMPHDPLKQDIVNRLKPPATAGHLLGTDSFGRDVLSRLIAGAQTEVIVAVCTTLLAAVLGSFLGLLGGYFGRIVEGLTMRVIVDVLLAFPPIVLALLAVTIYGPGPVTLTIVMGVLFSPIFARIAYGQVISIKHEEYVEAAEAFSAPIWTVLLRVIFPNAAAPIIAQLSLTMADAILLESGLSYLGLGVVPPAASWGGMVADGQRYISLNPYSLLIPSIVLIVTILAFSVLGDMLRDRLDPRRVN
ncbi:ABC transporter permease [Spelaeicoccus albus]|uniref:Peptide/nickel transport system permease protein n=1 Tax=Spelaeicoccus albus TaxID=1280376 RepID=A0A7Z0D4L8_9MICO|nr:ABC transporter permease [Spelaeicoccus albus]NYI68771.1 peptide/nickel transport system permease protein [Spelaeicoccus albus]